jgi:serine/threonine protein kinase
VREIHLQIHSFSCGPRNLLQNEAGQLKVSNFGLLGSKSHTDGGEACKSLGVQVFLNWKECFLSCLSQRYSLNPEHCDQGRCSNTKMLPLTLLSWHSDEYMAPEVYRKEQFDKNIDTFAFGLIVYEVYLLLRSSVVCLTIMKLEAIISLRCKFMHFVS